MGSFSEVFFGQNKFVIAIWSGVSSNDALSSPARTKRRLLLISSGKLQLLRVSITVKGYGLCGLQIKMYNLGLLVAFYDMVYCEYGLTCSHQRKLIVINNLVDNLSITLYTPAVRTCVVTSV
jgi:hypothetical protein